MLPLYVSEVLLVVAVLDLDDLELAQERLVQNLVFSWLIYVSEQVHAVAAVLVVDAAVVLVLLLFLFISFIFHALPLLHLLHHLVELLLSLLLDNFMILLVFVGQGVEGHHFILSIDRELLLIIFELLLAIFECFVLDERGFLQDLLGRCLGVGLDLDLQVDHGVLEIFSLLLELIISLLLHVFFLLLLLRI